MFLQKRETPTRGVTCQGQNWFSPGGPLGEIVDMGGNPTFHEMPPSISLVGGVPCVTARGKLYKNFQADPGGRVSHF